MPHSISCEKEEILCDIKWIISQTVSRWEHRRELGWPCGTHPTSTLPTLKPPDSTPSPPRPHPAATSALTSLVIYWTWQLTIWWGTIKYLSLVFLEWKEQTDLLDYESQTWTLCLAQVSQWSSKQEAQTAAPELNSLSVWKYCGLDSWLRS